LSKNLVLFRDTDADINSGLWVTDGTSAGTWEIAAGLVTSTGDHDPDPRYITSFGSEALFSSWGGLWVTDGTSPGTTEISVAGANTYIGLYPKDLFKFGSKVFFAGSDSTGGPFSLGLEGLWVTDGTSAGTSELSVANANTFSGLSPSDFTALGTKVLFIGRSATHLGLWVTNGTSAGTSEISLPGGPQGDLFNLGSPPTFAVLGNKAFFGAPDPSLPGFKDSLWVTDGTSAGTSEVVPGLGTADLTTFGTEVLFAGTRPVSGLFTSGLWVTDGTSNGTSELAATYTGPGDLTVFGSEALFFANPLAAPFGGGGPLGLWVTDGTQAGTSELVQFAPGSTAADLTVFGSEAVFSAFGAHAPFGQNSLWVTDGTSAGTTELTASGGAPIVLDPTNFTLFGSEILFSGGDATNRSLWATDGTAAGTFEISMVGASPIGAGPTLLTPFTQNLLRPVLSNVPGTQSYTERSAPLTLASSLHPTDDNSPTFTSATVSIVGGTFANDGDMLAATTTGTNISASYNSSTETLTLTGSDTVANYQLALDSVTFSSPSHNPTNYGSDPTRTISWVVNDGGASNNLSVPQTTTLRFTTIDDPPTLTGTAASVAFTEGHVLTLSPAQSVTDPDNLTLVDAHVSIVGGTFVGDGDVLSASTAGTNITVLYFSSSSGETLSLTGSDSLTHYQQVLDSVTFASGLNPDDYGSQTSRTLTWRLDDGGSGVTSFSNFSALQTTTIAITAVNNPPTLTNVAATVAVRGQNQIVTLARTLAVSDPDNLTLVGATVAIVGGAFSGDGDVLGATTAPTGISASYNAASETLTLTGTDTLAHYRQVLDSVTFESTNSNPTNFGGDPTRTVTWVANDGSGSNNLSAPAVTTIRFQSIPFDLNGDANSDLVFQNNGQAGVWLMNGTTPLAEAGLGNPGASWRIVTSRDVNGDGNADLIWQNSDGTPGIWLMNGTTPIAEAGFSNPGASWHIVAAGDLNGDGNADLVWQNSDGTLGIWLMNGTTPGAEAGIGNPGANWKVVGTADYNADGRDDILLQNTTTGNLMIDLMNGTTIASTVAIAVGDPSWHAVSTGVFNGQAEIAWQNSDGTPGVWVLNGTAPVAEAALPNPGAAWQVLSIDHFTPDGNGDLLFQNTNGAMGMWQMNGTNIVAETGLLSPGSGWQSVNGHSFTSG
jgi:VCBS repeat protein